MGFYVSDDIDNLQQRIYVLNEHIDIIKGDMHSFNFSERNPRAGIGGFICEMISRFYDKAKYTFALHINDEAELIKSAFGSKSGKKQADELTEALLNSYIKRSIQRHTDNIHRQKAGSSVRIRLNEKIVSILESSDENVYYDNNLKYYLEVLIYEYCSLAYEEREKIYFSKTLKIIEETIKSDKALHFKYKNNICSVLPYKVMFDNNVRYNYLIGTDTGTGRIVVFRLGIIRDIRPKEPSCKLTEQRISDINNRIAVNGVAYAGDRTVTARIRLTDHGYYNLYTASVIAHQKPKYKRIIKEEKDNNILEFECSFKNLVNYFIKYGEDAEALSPEDLRQRFKTIMDTASEYYK